jgi:glyoxylate reductase
VEQELGVTFVPLSQLFAESDFISLHVPLMPETRHLLDAKAFAAMKRSAIVINTSRGPVIDEAALVEALRNGVIAGAGMDVYEYEPKLTPGLAQLENVVLLPHIGSASIATRSKMAEIAARNVVAFFAGQKPPTALNPEVLASAKA